MIHIAATDVSTVLVIGRAWFCIALNAKESTGQVGTTSIKYLTSKFSRSVVVLDLYSPTKIIQPLTSQGGLLQGEATLRFHLV